MSDHTAGDWIPLMDYAMKKGISLSTLRRHIKAQKIDYRVEDGRYLLFDDEPESTSEPAAPVSTHLGRGKVEPRREAPMEVQGEVQIKLQRLERDLQNAREEIAELKTLIAFYEEQMSPQILDC